MIKLLYIHTWLLFIPSLPNKTTMIRSLLSFQDHQNVFLLPRIYICVHTETKGICWWLRETESHSVVSDSLWPHGLYSPWNSPGQSTGAGSLSLLQGIFPTQGSNQVSHIADGFFTSWAAREVPVAPYLMIYFTYIPEGDGSNMSITYSNWRKLIIEITR